MVFTDFQNNRVIPKEAMRCIACDRPLAASASVVAVFIEDRWTIWHCGCFYKSWRGVELWK